VLFVPVSVCADSQWSEPSGVPTGHEAVASPAAKTQLCNTEVYHCISCAGNTPRRSEPDECYGSGNCLRLCIVSVRCSVLCLCSFFFAVKMP